MIAELLLTACVVVKVHDGDTLTVQCPKRVNPIVLRIAEIDAPELAAFTWGTQPYAPEAAAEAQKVCGGQQAAVVHLNTYDKRTSRWIGHISCGGVDLSSHQVALGFAWSYLPDKKSSIPALMAQAQQWKEGLWALPNPVAPSVWRKNSMHQ